VQDSCFAGFKYAAEELRQLILMENIELMDSHVGKGLNVDAYRLIADRLALPRRSRAIKWSYAAALS
jgi:hypothetical protein